MMVEGPARTGTNDRSPAVSWCKLGHVRCAVGGQAPRPRSAWTSGTSSCQPTWVASSAPRTGLWVSAADDEVVGHQAPKLPGCGKGAEGA